METGLPVALSSRRLKESLTTMYPSSHWGTRQGEAPHDHQSVKGDTHLEPLIEPPCVFVLWENLQGPAGVQKLNSVKATHMRNLGWAEPSTPELT